MQRPKLREIPQPWLVEGEVTVTMSIDQWDPLLAAAYDEGFILLELDDDENPVNGYQKAM